MMTGGDKNGDGEDKLLLQPGNDIEGDGKDGAVASFHRLPSDHDVSLLLRSYRDLHQQNNHHTNTNNKRSGGGKKSHQNRTLVGGKSRPIGLAKALQHLFHDAKVPSSTFGQRTYTALLTCCSTPAEARRVFGMMDQSNVDVDDVAWSVLVDVHARLGDYAGAAAVMDEMSARHGLVPPITAYTSFLAGCYRVVNSGSRAPQHVKADAGKMAWDKWKEMRIVGHLPDVMAYGAILRVLAAQGRPERAISVLEEMVAMEVKPTTLCFSSALRAVHRSHANALRFQGGYSKKNKRRERITAHHGRMARGIVIQAENAEVRQDDGFVSALMMCAATAGDTATAKAIYLANKVRRRKDLRSIGGPDHLRMLRGETSSASAAVAEESLVGGGDGGYQQIDGGGDGQHASTSDAGQSPTSRVFIPSSGKFAQQSQAVAVAEPAPPARLPTWQERVYGRDTRRLSALLHACSKAMEVNGLGNLWAGSTNLGYLDEWSLRAIETRPRPQYRDRSIPGMTTVDHLPPEMWEKDADKGVQTMSKRLRREKYRGIEAKEDELMRTMDELDSDLYNMLRDPNEPPAFDSGGNIGDMKRKEEQGLLSSIDNYEAPALPGGQSEEEEEETISFMDAVEQTEGLLGGQASFDVNTGAITSQPAIEPTDEENLSPSHANDISQVDSANDDDDEDIDVDLDELQKENPELYELLMSQEGAPNREDDDDVSSEEEAAALEQLKLEDPELYRMLMATDEEDDVGAVTSLQDQATVASLEDQATDEEDDADLFEDMDDNLRAELKAGDFEAFYAGLQREMQEAGENEAVDANEARELFEMLRSVEGDEDDDDESLDENDFVNKATTLASLQEPDNTNVSSSNERGVDLSSDEFQRLYSQLEQEMAAEKKSDSRGEDDKSEQSFDDLFADYFGDDVPAQNMKASMKQEGAMTTLLDSKAAESTDAGQLVADPRLSEQSTAFQGYGMRTMEAIPNRQSGVSFAPSPARSETAEVVSQEADTTYGLADTSAEPINEAPMTRQEQVQQELRDILPGLPERRIKQLEEQFRKTPGDPSLLRLVPILRETLPDYVNLAWLKHKNRRAALTVMAKAEDDGLVDIHMLNSMLDVETSAGGLDRAVAYHEDEFARKKMNPTPYSDRLVLQMMVKNKRISRALAFKDKVENQGRHVDLASYGSIIEHYANRNQLGSALMMLKECIATHGSPPGERSLSKIRLICRKKGITKEVALEQMIGKDPLEWLRHGEEFKKHESSYKGRRQVTLPGNRLLQI